MTTPTKKTFEALDRSLKDILLIYVQTKQLNHLEEK